MGKERERHAGPMTLTPGLDAVVVRFRLVRCRPLVLFQLWEIERFCECRGQGKEQKTEGSITRTLVDKGGEHHGPLSALSAVSTHRTRGAECFRLICEEGTFIMSRLG